MQAVTREEYFILGISKVTKQKALVCGLCIDRERARPSQVQIQYSKAYLICLELSTTYKFDIL